MGPCSARICCGCCRRSAVGYAITVPFYRWLDLQRAIRAQPTWVPVARNVTGFTIPHARTPWQIPVAVTIYRTKVRHRATKNYQLDPFDPNDRHYEYAAVTSNNVPGRARGVHLLFMGIPRRSSGTVGFVTRSRAGDTG